MSGTPVKDKRTESGVWSQTVDICSVENQDYIAQNTVAGADIVLDGIEKKPVDGRPAFRCWFAAKDQALAGGDTLTFKFYRNTKIGASNNNALSEVEIEAAAITITTPAVAAGKVKWVDVTDDDDIFKSADSYSISGTITVATGGFATLYVGKSQPNSHIVTTELDEAFSSSSSSIRVEEIDPITIQNVYGDHVVDESNEAAGTYRVVISWEHVKNGSIQWNISGGVTMTIWATNDSSADSSSDSGWEDVTSIFTGNASEVDNTGFAFINGKYVAKALMIKRVLSDATNASDVFVSKGAN